jgi:MFS family permease
MARRPDASVTALVAEGFLSRLSFGVVKFALPLYAYHLGLSLSEIGFLASVNAIVTLVLKPGTARLADRFGCKPMLLGAIGLRSIVSLLLVFAAAPWQLYAVRSVHGAATSLRDPSVNALLAEHGGKKAVASAFAWYQTAKTLAGSIGAGVAGILLTATGSNYSLVFGVAFLLSTLPLLPVGRFVREEAESAVADVPAAELPTEAAAQLAADDAAAPAQATGRKPAILPFIGLGFLISGTAQMVSPLLPVLATQYAGLSAGEAGAIYLASTAVILTGPAFGWLSDHVSRKLVLRVRSGANTASSLIFLFAPNLPGFALGAVVDGVGKAAFRPAWGSLMAHVAGFDRRRRATTMGLISMGEDGGEIAGPIAAGFLWNTYGAAAMLGTRAVVAVASEIYTIALARSLERLETPPADRPADRPAGATAPPPGIAAASPGDRA